MSVLVCYRLKRKHENVCCAWSKGLFGCHSAWLHGAHSVVGCFEAIIKYDFICHFPLAPDWLKPLLNSLPLHYVGRFCSHIWEYVSFCFLLECPLVCVQSLWNMLICVMHICALMSVQVHTHACVLCMYVF